MSSNHSPDISHSDERSPLLGFHGMEKSDMNGSLEKQEPANEEKKGANTWSKAPTLRERARLLDQNQSGRKARHIGDAG